MRPNSLKQRTFLAVLMAALMAFPVVAAGQAMSKAKTKAPAPEQPIVLKGGKLLTITHGVIENGTLVIENGKIAAVGAANAVKIPANAKVVDVTGMTVYPGLIDSWTQLGLTEISAERMTNDLVETSDEIMPHMHVADAFHAESALIPVTRLNGITNAIVVPSEEDTMPGEMAFIQLAGRDKEDMLLVRDIAMPLNFTGEQRRNESFQNSKYPSTRMGMATQIRQTFIDAQEYKRKWDEYNKKQSENSGDKGEKNGKESNATPPKRDLKMEALLPYLEGKKPVLLTANEPSDILTALNLAKEFNLKVILGQMTYSEPILDQIAASKLPVVVGSIYSTPKNDERYDEVFRLPAELAKRGVKIAFASYDAHNVRNLPYEAGYAVGFGLPYDEALKAVTINPAEIWGVADQLGSLDVGKTANVVVANGDPLDVKTDVKQVYINGKAIPMVSRQTELRDQYQ
jgi:imidazolonepropionase-like amidohydrolase